MARIIVQPYSSTRGSGQDKERFRVITPSGRKLALSEAYASTEERDAVIKLLFDPATEVLVAYEDGTEREVRSGVV